MTSEAYITRRYYSEKPAASEALSLSVIVSPTAFLYAISTAQFKNVVELCHVEISHLANTAFDMKDKITYLTNNYLLPQRKFEKVNVSFFNHAFTLVPQAFVAEPDLKPFLQFATGTDLVKRSLRHTLRDLNFCFTVEQELMDHFEKLFPQASIRHLGAVSIALFFSQHSLKNANLLLSISDGYIEIAAKQRNELLFYNSFNVENNEDILYYLLFTMEQFELNPLHVRLSVAGEKAQNDELITTIKKYIRQVDFCVTDASVHLNGELASLPRHFYFTLLNQHLCEL